ncbi:hypothetical protein PINS_up003521 [Pythium insidiosum]|nr:hypothetical protein PINS_up003521 [Pythium insidiosum]
MLNKCLYGLLGSLALHDVEAKRQQSVSSMEEFWTFIAVVYGLMFVPVIGFFVYMILRDPAASQLVTLMWQWLKGKTFNFLSPSTESGMSSFAPTAIHDASSSRVHKRKYTKQRH